jgi:hypothetical protein
MAQVVDWEECEKNSNSSGAESETSDDSESIPPRRIKARPTSGGYSEDSGYHSRTSITPSGIQPVVKPKRKLWVPGDYKDIHSGTDTLIVASPRVCVYTIETPTSKLPTSDTLDLNDCTEGLHSKAPSFVMTCSSIGNKSHVAGNQCRPDVETIAHDLLGSTPSMPEDSIISTALKSQRVLDFLSQKTPAYSFSQYSEIPGGRSVEISRSKMAQRLLDFVQAFETLELGLRSYEGDEWDVYQLKQTATTSSLSDAVLSLDNTIQEVQNGANPQSAPRLSLR